MDKVTSEVTFKSYTVFVDPETGALSEQSLLEKGIEFQINAPVLSILAKNQAEPFELLRMKTPDEREAKTRRLPGSAEDGVAGLSFCILAILAKRFESGRDGHGATHNEKTWPWAKHILK